MRQSITKAMKTIDNLTPYIATHLGEVLSDELEANGITQTEFSKTTGINKNLLTEIMEGKQNINGELSIMLEQALGIHAEYWLELQKNYESDRTKIEVTNKAC